MQDNQAHPTPSADPQSGRRFELPLVSELRRAGQPPVDAEAANYSHSSVVAREELSSMTSPPPATRSRWSPSYTFQRRWEQVQARFVDQAARRVDVTED